MDRIRDMIGKELGTDTVNRTLQHFARGHRPPVVGAVHVTCSDESEREIIDSFQHWFADPLLPVLKYWNQSVFRTANLGGRYEWGAVRIAEEHYATPETNDAFKLLAVKINSHVAVNDSGDGPVYGHLDRYACLSACCGALNALLAGTRHPAMDEMRTTFGYDGVDRLGMLLDPNTIESEIRPFVAAVVNARLQARSAIVDIQNFQPESPTIFVVVPCVTLNRKKQDTEFVVGIYWSDSREGPGQAHYWGLGDDPSRYVITRGHQLQITDDQIRSGREARDHRQMIVKQWEAYNKKPVVLHDPRVGKVAKQLSGTSNYTATMARESLKTLLWLGMDIAPVPLSILLFAKGIASVHNLYQMHRLACGKDGAPQARPIIEEVLDQIGKLPPDQAAKTVRAILTHYQPASDTNVPSPEDRRPQ